MQKRQCDKCTRAQEQSLRHDFLLLLAALPTVHKNLLCVLPTSACVNTPCRQATMPSSVLAPRALPLLMSAALRRIAMTTRVMMKMRRRERPA